MQLPLIGNGILVKNLKNILNKLNDEQIISVDLNKNLVVLKKEKLYESDTYICLYREELRSYTDLRKELENESYRDSGNN